VAGVRGRDGNAKLTAALLVCLVASLLAFGGAASARDTAGCRAKRGNVAISGRVLYAAGVKGGRVLSAFNGTRSFTARPNEAGAYCVQVAGSTRGTHIALFATAVAAVPQAADVVVPKKAQATVKAKDINVSHSASKGGFVIGVAYIRIVSGRPTKHFGIGSYDGRLPLRMTGRRSVSATTSPAGVYRLPLAPGRYTLKTRRNVAVNGIVVRSARTTVVPVFSGETIVF
jgi:hypothetical protein